MLTRIPDARISLASSTGTKPADTMKIEKKKVIEIWAMNREIHHNIKCLCREIYEVNPRASLF